MLKSFYHTGFVVKDLDASARFYSDVLGMQIGERFERQGEFVEQVLAFPGAHIDRAMLDKGEGHKLELIQYLSPPSAPSGVERNDLGAAHLAFFVEDLDRFYAETSEKGLRFNNPPSSQLNDQGKVSIKACYAQDPDGNWLEFVEVF